MVETTEGEGRLKGVRIIHSAPIISQLCFANGTILFSQATVHEVEVVRSILNKYAAASGQIINLEKSTMVFSPNAHKAEVDVIQQILPFQVVEKFDK